jgi:hypothetical protein
MTMNVPGWIPEAPAMGCLRWPVRAFAVTFCALFRRYPCGFLDPFRTLHNLRCVAVRRSRECEVLEGRSARRLPARPGRHARRPDTTIANIRAIRGRQVTCAPARLSAESQSCNECPEDSSRFPA